MYAFTLNMPRYWNVSSKIASSSFSERKAKLHKYKCDILIIKFNEKNKGMDKGNVFKTIFTKLDIRSM